MKRFVGYTLIFSSIVLGLFTGNIFLYTYVPAYHNALEKAVSGDDEIPVVTVDKSKDENEAVIFTEDEEEVPLSDKAETVSDYFSKEEVVVKPQIIDKSYHEDCGTGIGYWVVTYSDGSTKVE
mgnify:CR=1 FL=1